MPRLSGGALETGRDALTAVPAATVAAAAVAAARACEKGNAKFCTITIIPVCERETIGESKCNF
jgi:hypothetical protein